MNTQDFNDEKYRSSSRHLKTTQQSDSYRGTGVYLTLDSQNFRDDPEDYHFPVKSPDELIPKFFHDLDMKTSTRGNEIPLPIKIASTPTIYSPDDDIDRYRSDSLSENRVQTEQDQSVNATPSNFRKKYRRSLTNKGDKTPQYAQDKEDFQGKEDFLGMVDRSYNKKKGVIDNFAAALVARVKVKGAFNNAAENRVFDASNQELNLINDKAFIVNHKEIEKKQRVIRSQRKKGGRLRQILEKHGIISPDLRKRREQANKINRNSSAMQNISNKFANCKDSLRDFGLGLVESLRRGRDRMKESFGSLYIHPQSRFRLCWDFLAMMFIFYDLVYIPFIICFDVPTTLGTFAFDTFKDIFFMVDVPLNFKTGYMEDGALITDPTLIRKNYLRGWFTIDFLTSIPVTLIFDLVYQDDSYGSSVRAIRLIRFIRFVRIARVFKAIKLQRLFATMEEFFYSSVFNGIKGLIGLFFTILILAHWVACIWYLVGSIVLDSTGQSWLTNYDISEADNSDKYIAAMYWAIATMLTVGYGDISPISTPERLYNIIVMLMGCAIFGYSMNSIGILVQSIQAGVSRTRQMYYNLSKYMDQKRVSKNMRSKVIHYLDYMIEAQKHGKMAEDQLFSILSDNIKTELKKDINGQVLRENVLLQKNFGNKFLSILSNSLEEKIFSPGEVIFDEMDKTCHMYFIATGTVDLYYSDCNVILKKLERESHFGEIAFFTGKSRTAAARSSTFSDIFFIRRDSFLTLVEDYTGDKEMFHLIKDNIGLYNTFEAVAVTCLLCNNEGHVARDCHRVHYIPDKEKIIKKHHTEMATFCKNFKRERSRNHFHAKRKINEIATRAREYCVGHTNQIQKFLHDSFETSFFKGAVETKSITEQQGIFKMPARSKTDTSLPAVPDENKYKQTEKNVATSIEEGEVDGGITDRAKKSHGFHIKTMSRNKKMKLMLNSRLRMKVIDKRGKKNQAEVQEEEFEENEVTETDENQIHLAPGPTLQIPRRSPSRNFTVVPMDKGMNDNNYLFGVVDLQGLNSEIIRPKLIPLEMVANFSIYFPHNNISKILMDLKSKKQGKKDSFTSEKMEAIFKRAKNEGIDDKRRGSVSPFGRGRGSVDDKRRGSISPFSRGRLNSDDKKRGSVSPDIKSRRKSLFVWAAKSPNTRDSVSEQRESRVATNADEETSIVKSLMNNDKIDVKHQGTTFSKGILPFDSTKATQLYMTLNSQNFLGDPDEQESISHSPQRFMPKFLQNLGLKNSLYHQLSDNVGKEGSNLDPFPFPFKLESNSSIYTPNDIKPIRENSFKLNHSRRKASDLREPSSQASELNKSLSHTSVKEAKEGQDEKENHNKEEDDAKTESHVMDNFTAALVARAKVKGAFNHAVENRVFDASNQELILINDKAYIVDYKGIDRKQRVLRSQRRKGARLKLILQKHGILSENLRKKKKPTSSKVSRRKSTIGDLKARLNDLNDRATTCWRSVAERFIHVKEDICDTISNSYINPHGRFRLFWDTVSMLFIFYDLVNVPYVICFEIPSTEPTFLFDIFKDLFFIIDVILNFKTAYVEDGSLITDSTLITKKYLRTWFTVDFLTALPISLIVDLSFGDEFHGTSAQAFRLLKFLRFARLARIFKAIRLKKLFVKMEEFFYSSVFNGIKGLIGLFATIILFAHWVACIWHLVGSYMQDLTGDSWMIHYDIAEASNADRYVASMYWAIATMLTVGYGDILPVSTPERAFNIIVMLMGCAIFGYSMNSIGILVQSIQAGVSRTRQMYYSLSKYMDQKKVSKNIRSKVIHYLDYMIETQKHGKMVEDQLFSILSDNIRTELKRDINGQVLRDNTLLQRNFGNKFLSILSNSLEEKIFSPGEVIFDETDRTCHMYFIATGTVDLYYSDCNVILKKLERDCHFGEIAFFTGKSRTAAARSSTFSDIFFIRRDLFLALVEDYSGDKETFHLIKDNISLYDSFDALKVKCLLCNNEGHVARNCHRVHYVPNKDKILSKHHAIETLFSRNFKRERARNLFSARADLTEIQTRAADYCTTRPVQIQKLLNNTFGTSFFSLVNKVRFTATTAAIKSNVNDSSASPNTLPSESDELTEEGDPSEVPATTRNQIASTEQNLDQSSKLKNPPNKKPNKRRNLRLFLNPRFRAKLRKQSRVEGMEGENSPEKAQSHRTTEQSEKRITVIKMPNGLDLSNQKVVFEVVESNNQNNTTNRPNLTNEETPLEMVANFSIYFPHNNITKILTDLKTLRKDPTSEKLEVKLKKLKSHDNKNKRKSFFFSKTPTSRKSKFVGFGQNSKDFKESLKDSHSEAQTPATFGTAKSIVHKFDLGELDIENK